MAKRFKLKFRVVPLMAKPEVNETTCADMTADLLLTCLRQAGGLDQITMHFRDCVRQQLQACNLAPRSVDTEEFFDMSSYISQTRQCEDRRLMTARWRIDNDMLAQLLPVYRILATTMAVGIARVPTAQLICMCGPDLSLKVEGDTVRVFAYADLLCYPDS